MKTIIGYIKPYVGRMCNGFVIKFIGTIMDLLLPWILSYMIDDIIPLKDTGLIFKWGVVMVICSAIGVLGNVWANRKASSVARDFTRDVRHDLYVKVMDLSSRQVDDLTIPSLVSRLTTDTYNLHQMVGMMQRLGVRAPILIIGGVFVTMTLEPVLCLILIATLPFIGLVVYFVSRKGIPMFTMLQKKIDGLVKVVRENVTGVRVIKALSKSEYEKARFETANRAVVDEDTRANNTMALINPLMNVLLNVGLVLIIIVGGYRVHIGVSEPGKIVAFLSYFTTILTAMLNITRLFIIFSKASASANRVEEVLLSPKDLRQQDLPDVPTDDYLVFSHVSFSYNGQENAVTDLNFKLKKGQSLGIIGATGSGKTTIVSLLMRFYDIQQGEIVLDGKNIKAYDDQSLKEKFGVTFQNDTIFGESIAENIRFGRDLSDQDIASAARHAIAEEFISQLPQGFETRLEAKVSISAVGRNNVFW